MTQFWDTLQMLLTNDQTSHRIAVRLINNDEHAAAAATDDVQAQNYS